MKRILIGLAVVAVVVAAGVGAAFITGVVPGASGNSDTSGSADETYQKTVVVQGTDSGSNSGGDKASGGSSTDGSGSGDADSAEQPPFSFRIKSIEECGQTCREVTASVTNNQDVTAGDVTVRSVIYTDGEKVWEGKSSLGNVESGETVTDTKTVKLGYMEAYKIKQNDGEILVKTYVITAEGTYVYKDTRDVA